MKQDAIEDHEYLFRAIKPPPIFWNTKTNKPSSALFKDSLGMSVDRDGEREQKIVNAFFKSRFENLKGLAKLSAKACREEKCKLIPKPEQRNPFHAQIEGESKVQLTDGQARALSRICDFISFE